jgi:hypothetical protein
MLKEWWSVIFVNNLGSAITIRPNKNMIGSNPQNPRHARISQDKKKWKVFAPNVANIRGEENPSPIGPIGNNAVLREIAFRKILIRAIPVGRI